MDLGRLGATAAEQDWPCTAAGLASVDSLMGPRGRPSHSEAVDAVGGASNAAYHVPWMGDEHRYWSWVSGPTGPVSARFNHTFLLRVSILMGK